jgi:hypothetical protein
LVQASGGTLGRASAQLSHNGVLSRCFFLASNGELSEICLNYELIRDGIRGKNVGIARLSSIFSTSTQAQQMKTLESMKQLIVKGDASTALEVALD